MTLGVRHLSLLALSETACPKRLARLHKAREIGAKVSSVTLPERQQNKDPLLNFMLSTTDSPTAAEERQRFVALTRSKLTAEDESEEHQQFMSKTQQRMINF